MLEDAACSVFDYQPFVGSDNQNVSVLVLEDVGVGLNTLLVFELLVGTDRFLHIPESSYVVLTEGHRGV